MFTLSDDSERHEAFSLVSSRWNTLLAELVNVWRYCDRNKWTQRHKVSWGSSQAVMYISDPHVVPTELWFVTTGAEHGPTERKQMKDLHRQVVVVVPGRSTTAGFSLTSPPSNNTT